MQVQAEFFRVEVTDHVATVFFDRPPVNAVNQQCYREAIEVFRTVGEDREVRCAVFASALERTFCAGADVRDFADRTPENYPERAKLARDAFWAVYDCAVPVIGAINGPALGTGLAFASMCDIIIAAEEAVFGLPEVNVGSLGGAAHLSRLVPQMKARKMMFTGERISARDAAQYGFIEKVVPRDQVLAEARGLAAEIASKSPVTIRLAKEAFNKVEFMELKEGYALEQTYTARLTGHPDALEAARAFVEKRAPVFKGL
ncbi:MAG TPA: enoyl-CoA hydratase-related protein [Dehalococcoidia bacterium]|nr:enoyl-CoA hydratase-related protein [Dehalococcoidia bacterium]